MEFNFEDWFNHVEIVNTAAKSRLYDYLIENDYNSKSSLLALDVSTLPNFSGGVKASLKFAIENLRGQAPESGNLGKTLSIIQNTLHENQSESKAMLSEINSNYNKIVDNINFMNNNINTIVPMVCNLVIEKNNLWSKSAIGSVATERGASFRENLLEYMGLSPQKGKKFPCMITGEYGLGSEVIAAHIIPAKSEVRLLGSIGIRVEDVDSPCNGLLLAKGIEHAFDRLQLSFVMFPQSDALIMKIWDDECRADPIWPGHDLTIGQFDGSPLRLNGHNPFKRALSYQAYSAYLHFSFLGVERPIEYGSDTETEFYQQRKLMKDPLIQELRAEMLGDKVEAPKERR